MRFLSLFSGIEAASVAWGPLGWKAAAFAEVEEFPCAVLKHHYPGVPNLGDVTKFKEWPDLGPVDIVCGGSPCQSFSVAGLRKGLADPRGNLSLTFLAIADRYRPRYVIWENVPGVLSSNGGRDFAAFLGGLGELGYGWCYRIVDAQYARVDGFPRAVPQRRRRVIVVGCLGDWRRAAAVLSEPESVLGDSPPRREAGEAVAEGPPRRTASGRETFGTLMANCGSKLWLGNQEALTGDYHVLDVPVAHSLRGEGFDASEDGTGRGTPIVPIAIQERAVSENAANGPDGKGWRDDGASYTLEARQVQQAVATGWAVRRLTTTECERLQGFPDSYTDIPWRGKPTAPDGPRYKALGNSWAVNVFRWAGTRIELVEEVAAEIENERMEAAE